MTKRSAQPDSRIGFGIRQIGEKIHQYEDRAEKEHRSLDRRQIAATDRIDDVAANARPGKYRLGQDASREIRAEVEPKHRDDGNQRVPEAVTDRDQAFLESLRAGGANEVGMERVEHR